MLAHDWSDRFALRIVEKLGVGGMVYDIGDYEGRPFIAIATRSSQSKS
jgi:hypothetical protein